jgi:hypothetical protein
MQTRMLPICLVALLSVSCSAAIAPPPQPSKTVIDEQLKAIDKAKAVQQTVDQQKIDTDKQINAAEGVPADPDKKGD